MSGPVHLMFSALSPAGRSARLNIFIFHRVHAQPDPLFPGEVDAQRFDRMLGWLSRWFHVLPLDEAVRRLAEGSLPAAAAAITFDDGYADNCTVAMPLLNKHGLPATVFVASGFLDGGRMWNDTLIESIRLCTAESLDLRHLSPAYADLPALPLGGWEARRGALSQLIPRTKYLPISERQALVDAVARHCKVEPDAGLMMSSEQLRQMRRAGFVIGAHTVTHPILARLGDDEARREISDGKRALELILDEPVSLFAYPNGKPGDDYLPCHVEMVRDCRFEAAVTTSPGAARFGTDQFQVPRFTPWDRSQIKFGLRLLNNLRS